MLEKLRSIKRIHLVLGVVIALTLPCYLAGLIVFWNDRLERSQENLEGTITATMNETIVATPTFTAPVQTETITPTATMTPTFTSTITYVIPATETPTPTLTFTATLSPTASQTATASPTVSGTPVPIETDTPVPDATAE